MSEAGVRKSYVDTSGGQIHVRSMAGEGMPIVFFHQTASSGQMWLKTMQHLARPDIAGTWPMHALDTPGFGGSFDVAEDVSPSMTEYVGWLGEAVRALGIARCHVVGHHTGSCIGVELAARQPDLVASLTMIGPVPLTAQERVEFSKYYGTPFSPVVSGSYLLDNWEYLRQLGAHADPQLIHREMVDQMRAYIGRVKSYSAVWGQDFPHFYRQVTAPMMIAAAPDDVLHPYLARAAEMRPDARVLPIDGANFEPDLDAANFSSGLAAFLRDVAE